MATTNGIVYFDGSKIATATTAKIISNIISSPLAGVTDASSAASGVIGEVIRSNVPATGGSPVAVSSATYTDITNITLTAGDWEIYGSIGFSGVITGTQIGAFYATASGNVTTGINLSENTVETITVPTSVDVILTTPTYRVNLNGSQTYYLKAFATYTIGSLTAYGTISARRMR